MGFFDKFFGKNNSDNDDLPERTNELLEEDLYWKIVDATTKKRDQEKQLEALMDSLRRLPVQQVIGFKLRTYQLTNEISNGNMWCAAYLMNGGCSDDGFDYFKYWVISRGKKTYLSAKSSPDNLFDELDDEVEGYEFEEFHYASNDVFKEKTGMDIYGFMDDSAMANETAIQFNWEEDKPETMKAICPKLYAAQA